MQEYVLQAYDSEKNAWASTTEMDTQKQKQSLLRYIHKNQNLDMQVDTY